MYNIKDVASRAGVSVATVSRCFNNTDHVNEQTREHVLKVAAEMNFVIKKYQRHQKRRANGNVIGVLIPHSNPFFIKVTKAIKEIAEQKNMNVIVCDSQEKPEREILYLEMMRNIVNGLIVVPTSQTADYNANYIKEINNNIPVVLFDRDITITLLDGVFVDGYHGSYEAVQSLINNGHREIAIISGPITCKPGLDRLNGYLEALKKNDITIKEEYILYGDFDEDKAYTLTNKLLDIRKSVTAVFSSNLVMTYGFLRAIDERGLKIPDDISFISFDDDLIFSLLKISCISNPGFQAGEEAATYLINRMQRGERIKNTPTRRIILMPQLVLRGSEKYPINRS